MQISANFGALRSRGTSLAFLLLSVAACRVEAAFIGPYAPGNFNLINTNADGFATLNLDGTLLITGGNTGSGVSGTTDFLVSAAGNGLVTFNFSYQTQDDVLAEVVGYMVGSTFTQLADRNGTAGAVSFAVASGQSFGFRIRTEDNLGEPGYLTISSFDAPLGSGGAAVPESSTWLPVAGGLTFLWSVARRKCNS